MAYLICSTERTRSPASDTETKALLHLMSFDDASEDIEGFAIDFFNDVTGLSRFGERLYDVQSKAAKSAPAMIGQELVTLFKNYCSPFKDLFAKEILFLGGVSPTVLGKRELEQFTFEDLEDRAKKGVRKGLLKACEDTGYIKDEYVTDANVDGFLNQVCFVVSKGDKADYVKPLIKTGGTVFVTPRKLEAVFNEIKHAQSRIKEQDVVEGKQIESPDEAYLYGRVIERKDVQRLVLQRLINWDVYQTGIPDGFRPFLERIPPERDNEITDACQNDIARQLFDKNAASDFWRLFGAVVTAVENAPNANVEEIFESLDQEVIRGCSQLGPMSARYFIAVVMDGVDR